MRAAVIDLQTNIVANVIVADAIFDPAPEGFFLVDVTNVFCGIGWIYDPQTGEFTNPVPPEPVSPEEIV
jgi:hypothetical protein